MDPSVYGGCNNIYMMAPQTQQQIEEDKDFRREQDVKELKETWFDYSPEKRVDFTLHHPNITKNILTLIEKVK